MLHMCTLFQGWLEAEVHPSAYTAQLPVLKVSTSCPEQTVQMVHIYQILRHIIWHSFHTQARAQAHRLRSTRISPANLHKPASTCSVCPAQLRLPQMLHVTCHPFSELVDGKNINGAYRSSHSLESSHRIDSKGETLTPSSLFPKNLT